MRTTTANATSKPCAGRTARRPCTATTAPPMPFARLSMHRQRADETPCGEAARVGRKRALASSASRARRGQLVRDASARRRDRSSERGDMSRRKHAARSWRPRREPDEHEESRRAVGRRLRCRACGLERTTGGGGTWRDATRATSSRRARIIAHRFAWRRTRTSAASSPSTPQSGVSRGSQKPRSEAFAWFERTCALPSRDGGAGAKRPLPAPPKGSTAPVRGPAAIAPGAVAKFFSASVTAAL